MDKLLIDTNIVIDLLAKRDSFFEEAQELFTLADQKKIELVVSALTFANTHYIISRHHSIDDTRKLLIKFKVLVSVASIDDKIIELALASDFRDFEDAVQHQTALESEVDLIITRNKKDFKHAKIPVLTAKEYLKIAT